MTGPRWDPTAGEQPAPLERGPPWGRDPFSLFWEKGAPSSGPPPRGAATRPPEPAALLATTGFLDRLIAMPLSAEQRAELQGVFCFSRPAPPWAVGAFPPWVLALSAGAKGARWLYFFALRAAAVYRVTEAGAAGSPAVPRRGPRRDREEGSGRVGYLVRVGWGVGGALPLHLGAHGGRRTCPPLRDGSRPRDSAWLADLRTDPNPRAVVGYVCRLSCGPVVVGGGSPSVCVLAVSRARPVRPRGVGLDPRRECLSWTAWAVRSLVTTRPSSEPVRCRGA